MADFQAQSPFYSPARILSARREPARGYALSSPRPMF
jgi:hypothetical protein